MDELSATLRLGEGVVGDMTKRLAEREPRLSGLRSAAVSVVVIDKSAPKLLLIRRAERAGDPWSGQIAFPGGKSQPEDKGIRGTAVRETSEEVGIDLLGSAEFLGYGEPMRTHTGAIEVVPCVFLAKAELNVRANEEVASYRWLDVGSLLSPDARVVRKIESEGRTVEMPAILVSDYIVWGLTYRILSSLLGGFD